MFRYKKQIAYIALILFVALTIVIWLFALQSGEGSGKSASKLYAFLFGLDYDKEQVATETEQQNITSIKISSPAQVLLVGQSVSLNIACKPENYTETIIFSSSNEKIAKVNGKGLVTAYSKGTVTITATTNEGKLTSSVEIIVYEEAKALDNLDKNKFTLTVPDEMAPNDCVRPIILYDNQSIALDYTLISSNTSVLKPQDNYLVSGSEGQATLTVKVGGRLLFDEPRIITVKGEKKENPLINNVYVGDTPVDNEPITVFLGKNYNISVNLENELTAVQSYIIKRNNSITTAIYSNSSKNVQIYARQCGTTIVTLYSRTDLETPLKEFTLNIIPPRLVSLGLPPDKEYNTGVEYNFSISASDKNALEGYTYKVYDKDGSVVASQPNGNYKFDEIGEYKLVFTSEYYPDDVYTFTIILQDLSTKHIIRKEFGHFGLFALLGMLAMLAFGRLIEKFVPKSLVCALSGLFVAIISEILQLPIFTQNRGASLNDVFIDYIGYAFGLGLCFCIIHFIFYIKSRRSASSSTDK